MAREGQGYPRWRRDMMMMMMICVCVCVWRLNTDCHWTEVAEVQMISIVDETLAWLWLERASRFGSHADRVACCTDQFLWLSYVVLLRQSRPPDMANGNPASMSRTLRPVLHYPQILTLSRRARFIACHMRHFFLGECRRDPWNFWSRRACRD